MMVALSWVKTAVLVMDFSPLSRPMMSQRLNVRRRVWVPQGATLWRGTALQGTQHGDWNALRLSLAARRAAADHHHFVADHRPRLKRPCRPACGACQVQSRYARICP